MPRGPSSSVERRYLRVEFSFWEGAIYKRHLVFTEIVKIRAFLRPTGVETKRILKGLYSMYWIFKIILQFLVNPFLVEQAGGF